MTRTVANPWLAREVGVAAEYGVDRVEIRSQRSGRGEGPVTLVLSYVAVPSKVARPWCRPQRYSRRKSYTLTVSAIGTVAGLAVAGVTAMVKLASLPAMICCCCGVTVVAVATGAGGGGVICGTTITQANPWLGANLGSPLKMASIVCGPTAQRSRRGEHPHGATAVGVLKIGSSK